MELEENPAKRRKTESSDKLLRKDELNQQLFLIGNIADAVLVDNDLDLDFFNNCVKNFFNLQLIPFKVTHKVAKPTDDVESIIKREFNQFIDSTGGILIRLAVVQLTNSSFIIITIAQASACTETFLKDILQNLITFYKRRLNGLENSACTFQLPKMKKIDLNEFKVQTKYWKETLKTAVVYLDVSHIHQNCTVTAPNVVNVQIPKYLEDYLERVVQHTAITMPLIFLAAFQVLLDRYSSQENYFFPAFIPKLTKNPVFIPRLISKDETLRCLLAKVNETICNAQLNSDTPLNFVKSALSSPKETEEKLISAIFIYNYALEETGSPNVTWKPISNITHESSFGLYVNETSTGHELIFQLHPVKKQVLNTTRMSQHFISLLERLIKSLDATVGSHSMLTKEEVESYQRWNATESEYNSTQCIHELFESEAKKSAHKTAIIFGNQQITYSNLNQRANRLAHHLIKLDVHEAATVGVFMEKSIDMIICFLAILKTGGSYVPLDPSHPKSRTTYLINDVEPKLILTFSKLATQLPQSNVVLALDNLIPDERTENLLPLNNDASNSAYILYTSGTTGTPKGVHIQHRNTVALIHALKQIFSPTEVEGCLLAPPPNFCSFHGQLYYVLSTGNTGILSQSLLHVAQLPAKEKVTFIATVPTGFQELINAGQLPTSLRAVLFGGDTVRRELIQNCRQNLPNVSIYVSHGCTEATLFAFFEKIPNNLPDKISVGRPVPNMKTYITDSDLHRVPLDFSGELCISGPQIVNGYFKLDELTSQKFVTNPFENSNPSYNRMYRTGDVARWTRDGCVEILGRKDYMVKINGIRIELDEISNTLCQSESVKEAVVTVLRRDNQTILLAYYVANGETVKSQELRQFLQSKLPHYMIPTTYISIPEIPRNVNGKTDRQSLPIPSFTNRSTITVIAPESEMEKKLLILLKGLLNCDINSSTNLIDAGMDSIIATQMTIQIADIYKIDVSVVNLFQKPTVSELCKLIDDISRGDQQTQIDDEEVISLSNDIQISGTKSADLDAAKNPKHVFLTGATGFLGSFILEELMKQTTTHAYCLVRAANVIEAAKRLEETLREFNLWQDDFSTRITAIPGDINDANLGMNLKEYQKIALLSDSIYHCAANVNFVLPYSVLKRDAVQGTEQILRFAFAMKVKPLHFMSSIAVHDIPINKIEQVIIKHENDFPGTNPQTISKQGYERMKRVSETLIWSAAARGLPVTILRPSYVFSHTSTGTISTQEYITRLIKGCIEMQSYPDVNVPLWIVPVDYVSQATVYISRHVECIGKAFHITPLYGNDVNFQQLMEWIKQYGYPLEKLESQKWLLRLQENCQKCENNALYPLLGFVRETITFDNAYPNRKAMIKFDRCNLDSALKKSDIIQSKVDGKSLKLMLNFLVKKKFIKPPQ